MFKMSHEQTSIARSHFGAHGNATDLIEKVPIKFKRVECKHQFSKADKSRSGYRGMGTLVQKELQSPETICMGYRSVQRTDIKQEQTIGTIRRQLDGRKNGQGMLGVFQE